MRKFLLPLFALMLAGFSRSLSQNPAVQGKVADSNLVLPPSWAFGILYGGYTNQQETMHRVKEILDHDYPIDAYWIDSWFWSFADKGRGPQKYIDFRADTVSYPDRRAMWDYLSKNGIKGGFWIWDCIQETGNEKVFRDFKERGYFSNIFFNTNSWHNGSSSTAMFLDGQQKKGTLCGNINFDDPQAVAYFQKEMKPFFDEGADFIKLDRTSRISVCKAMFEMTQQWGKETKGRGFILSHTGGMESEDYKRYPAKWTDDTRSDWTVEKPLVSFNPWVPRVALKENIALYTDPSKPSSRIPFLTNDMGGFDMGKTSRPEEELYIRWMQFSMFCPITEVFSQPENPTSNLAWNYSVQADSLFRFYSHLRLRLFPYLYTYAHLSRLQGIPMIRKIPGQLYEFMLGDELLVAPVYEKGARTRTLYLPAGKWINYWTGEKLEGNRSQVVAAPLEKVPLFIREGSVIPMRNYAPSVEKGDNRTITLQIYPGSSRTFNLIEDDGSSNDYLSGRYAQTKISLASTARQVSLVINPREGAYTGMNQKRNWILRVLQLSKPSAVLINGHPSPFEFSSRDGLALIKAGIFPCNRKITIHILY